MSRTLGHTLLLFWAFGALFGCSRAQQRHPLHPTEEQGPAALLVLATNLATQGESNRAEQYYVAALQAGADPKDVYPLLVETCIHAGRLGSALQHADRHLRDSPEDLRLLRLAASLSEALGHERAAGGYAERIAQHPNRGAEEELFLGAYFYRQQIEPKAQKHLEKYLALTQEEDQQTWVRPTLRRLAQASELLLAAPDAINGELAE